MAGGVIGEIVALALGLAVEIAKAAGDKETAKRVEEILTDRFPSFPRRAEEKAEEIRRRLGGGPPSP
jgi:Tfp pilus assembly protein PilF